MLILLLSFSGMSIAQEDSLKNILNTTEIDSVKVQALVELSKVSLGFDLEEAELYANQANDLSINSGYIQGQAAALRYLGLVGYYKGNYGDVVDYWQQSLAMYDSVGDQGNVARLYSNLGAVYFNQSDDVRALEFYLKSQKVAEEISDTLRLLTAFTNIAAIYGKKDVTHDKALEYDKKALILSESINDKSSAGILYSNMAEIYLIQNKDSLALEYFFKAREATKNTEVEPIALSGIGSVYMFRKDYDNAIKYQNMAYEKASSMGSKLEMVQSLNELALIFQEKKDYKSSLTYFIQAKDLALEIDAKENLKEIYNGLAEIYTKQGDFKNAYKYQNLLTNIKDTLYNIAFDQKMSGQLFNYEIEKKQNQISLLNKDKELREAALRRQKIVKNAFIGGMAFVMMFLGVVFFQKHKITIAKQRSEELLLNILPEETAEELKETGSAKAKSFDSVTVMFTDFKNFTKTSEILSAEELVEEINNCYSEFDRIVTKYGIEKIKTIGDSYMCAGGLPVANSTHAEDCIKAGLEMQAYIEKNKKERIARSEPYFELRLGVHTGPVVAGIVGIKKFAYDIWGDTVNTASRMESSGEVGKVNISGTTYNLVQEKFKCAHRGKVEAKNKGLIDMYFVESIVNS